MSKYYRTAFAAPSGFVAATASAPKAAGPADRKAAQPGRPVAKAGRDPKIEARKPNQAA